MEISSVFENEYCSKIESFTSPENTAEWNGRIIKPLAGNKSSILSRVISIETKIYPMMSRPTNVEGELTGGYSEERGGYVEGKISASWGESKSSQSSSNSKTKTEPVNNSNSSDN